MNAYTFPKKTIKDIEVRNKRVLLRADFNVPINEVGEIDSDFRIAATLPTIEYLLKQKAEVVILAHLGRPEGHPNQKFSLKLVSKRLAELLGQPIQFIEESVGDQVASALRKASPGKVTLLENVRFHEGEEKNDPSFARQLVEATSPDYVVQDCFGVIHRAHASTEGISHIKPAVAGLLVEAEVTSLTKAVSHPNEPLVAVLGGAKISDKLPLLERFLEQAETILVGGALANTFLKFTGSNVGKSLVEDDQEVEVKQILSRAKPGQVILPVDVAVSSEVNEHAQRKECRLDHVHSSEYILDIGPVTTELFAGYIEKAGTIIWNGTLGYAENARFSKGSALLAKSISEKYASAESIIGGGDTADFVLQWQEHNKNAKFSHISTGGGASLELMSGKKLPGLEALINK